MAKGDKDKTAAVDADKVKEKDKSKEKHAAPVSDGRLTIHHALASIVVLLIAAIAASYAITETLDFGGLSAKALKLWRTTFPAKDMILTPEELAQYDGSDPNKPIYIAIRGIVYDVTVGRKYYGKDGSYGFFSGKDATRAYITGCFKTHLTHDIRGLTDADIQSLSTWTDFYDKHDKYFRVGRVQHPPISPDTPIPEPCEL